MFDKIMKFGSQTKILFLNMNVNKINIKIHNKARLYIKVLWV